MFIFFCVGNMGGVHHPCFFSEIDVVLVTFDMNYPLFRMYSRPIVWDAKTKYIFSFFVFFSPTPSLEALYLNVESNYFDRTHGFNTILSKDVFCIVCCFFFRKKDYTIERINA